MIKTIIPNIKALDESIRIILAFEYPNILRDKRSLFELSEIKNHIAEIKIMNGSNFIIKFGMYNIVKNIGNDKFWSISLKNSISSNKFRIIPKQINTKITLATIFKNPKIRYLLIILSIILFFQIQVFWLGLNIISLKV